MTTQINSPNYRRSLGSTQERGMRPRAEAAHALPSRGLYVTKCGHFQSISGSLVNGVAYQYGPLVVATLMPRVVRSNRPSPRQLRPEHDHLRGRRERGHPRHNMADRGHDTKTDRVAGEKPSRVRFAVDTLTYRMNMMLLRRGGNCSKAGLEIWNRWTLKCQRP